LFERYSVVFMPYQESGAFCEMLVEATQDDPGQAGSRLKALHLFLVPPGKANGRHSGGTV